MTTLNISLPETIQLFIEQQVAKGGYSNVSEYILHLILQEQAKSDFRTRGKRIKTTGTGVRSPCTKPSEFYSEAIQTKSATRRSAERGSAERSPSKPHVEA